MAFSAASTPAYTVSRMGQSNFTGDVRDLFLKLYAGEVLTAFEQKTTLTDKVRTRSITKGKSASFPILGRTRAEYMTPGYEITGGKIRSGERIVTIDDLLISAQFIPLIDEAISHYDVRSIYTKEAGIALGLETDRNIARTLAKAALSTNSTTAAALVQNYKAFDEEDFTANVTIGTLENDYLNPALVAKAIIDAKKTMDKANIPTDGMVVVLEPDTYYALLDPTDGTKLTYMNSLYGGTGAMGGTNAPNIAGLSITMSNSIAPASLWNGTTGVTLGQAPLAAESGRATAYDMPVTYLPTALKIKGYVFSQDAVAMVKLLDLAIESEYQMTRQGTLMVAKLAQGINVLRPACAIALIGV